MAHESLKQWVVDGLRPLGTVRWRAMFGGHGLYCEGLFIGLEAYGRLFLRVDDRSRPEYLAAGSQPFQPWEGTLMLGYYEAPAEALERPVRLLELASDALRVAQAAPAKKPRRKPAPRATRQKVPAKRPAAVKKPAAAVSSRSTPTKSVARSAKSAQQSAKKPSTQPTAKKASAKPAAKKKSSAQPRTQRKPAGTKKAASATPARDKAGQLQRKPLR